MSEDFGKWLKENKENRPRDLDAQGFGLIDFEEVVSVRALGEWHLGVTKKCIEVQKQMPSKVINMLGLSHREIAEGCLGKSEVEKRLCVGGRE